ncbi:MAG: tRNA (guanosine(37)-N1)-methyltransferase TrmD [Clostridia bacterium]|nr:tRNA (guanosine(37)-N1)-methyltransferase TrmD [Clostridia bacterium]
MRIKVFTLFPEMLRPMLGASILGRAIAAGLIEVELIDIRAYSADKHRNTDDYPFGGGAGMVMAAQPIVDAFAAHCPQPFNGRRVYLSPRGRTLNQRIVEELAREEEIALLCGHYEGVDQRALDSVIDEELSIGDYVLTGGELGALVVIDAVARLIPGVLGSEESSEDESFTTGLLEYPQYTRPANFRGKAAPEVLLGGNHAEIVAWRREQSLSLTLDRRPELLDAAPLDDGDRDTLARLKRAREIEARLPGLARQGLQAADQFPKGWFGAFVPEASRKAAKRQCFSGRRHVGYLWQAFSMGFIPAYTEGDTAWKHWHDKQEEGFLLYLPDERLLYRVRGGIDLEALSTLGHFILANQALTRTYVRTGKPGKGPYYCEIQKEAAQ